MKKITYFLIALFVSSLTLLSGCGNNGNTIRVNEVTHSIFYAQIGRASCRERVSASV